MNWAHAHLMVNHVPVMGAFFGLSLLGWGLVRRSDEVTRVGLWALALVGASGTVAYLSGNRAERVIEDLPGVSDALIANHEDAALLALIAAIAAGVFAGACLILEHFKGRAPGWCLAGCLVLAVASCLLMARAANLGGQIRHEEARPGWVKPSGEGRPSKAPPPPTAAGG